MMESALFHFLIAHRVKIELNLRRQRHNAPRYLFTMLLLLRRCRHRYRFRIHCRRITMWYIGGQRRCIPFRWRHPLRWMRWTQTHTLTVSLSYCVPISRMSRKIQIIQWPCPWLFGLDPVRWRMNTMTVRQWMGLRLLSMITPMNCRHFNCCWMNIDIIYIIGGFLFLFLFQTRRCTRWRCRCRSSGGRLWSFWKDFGVDHTLLTQRALCTSEEVKM